MNTAATKRRDDARRVAGILCRDLWVRFDALYALAGIDTNFDRGRPWVIRGPNGSGKTTLLSVVAGLLRPTRGEVIFTDEKGAVVPRAQASLSLAYFGQGAVVYQDLSALENLLFTTAIHGTSSPTDKSWQALSEMKIDPADPRPCRQMSHGQRRRIGLARVFVTNPSIILLDEPDAGLDPAAKRHLAESLSSKAVGALVLVATHDETFSSLLGGPSLTLQGGRIRQPEQDSSQGRKRS